jgi:hypothetical protein
MMGDVFIWDLVRLNECGCLYNGDNRLECSGWEFPVSGDELTRQRELMRKLRIIN